MTPEGRIKRAVSAMLEEYHVMVWKPVPSGYGASGLDYHCVVDGHSLVIETKKPNDNLTIRQRHYAVEHCQHDGTTFIISGPVGLAALKAWLDRNARSKP